MLDLALTWGSKPASEGISANRSSPDVGVGHRPAPCMSMARAHAQIYIYEGVKQLKQRDGKNRVGASNCAATATRRVTCGAIRCKRTHTYYSREVRARTGGNSAANGAPPPRARGAARRHWLRPRGLNFARCACALGGGFRVRVWR